MMNAILMADPRARLIQSKLDQHGLSYRWLAERMEINHVSVTEWVRGDVRPRDRTVFDRMLSVIASHEATTETNVHIRRAGIRRIPVMGGLSAGSLSSVQTDVDFLEVKDWGTGLERWGRVVEGYSMEPLLMPGDLVVFEQRPYSPYDIVHAFGPDGSDTVKVVRGHGAKVELVPINPDYQVIPGIGMEIRGVAIMRIRKGPDDSTHTSEFPHGMRCRDLPEKTSE